MAIARYTVVGLGELLWDLLPAGKHLGGAPANFAYITSLLGDEGIPASRVGADDLGGEALRHLTELGIPIDSIQNDANHPTGTVKVEVDAAGQHDVPPDGRPGRAMRRALRLRPQRATHPRRAPQRAAKRRARSRA